MSNNPPINDGGPASFPLSDLLSGQHNDLLRKLAAKSVGWSCDFPQHTRVWLPPKDFNGVQWEGRILPNYPASLDACKELRDALTEEEKPRFLALVLDIMFNDGNDNSYIYLFDATPLHLLIAFCLTRNLIKLK